ncbi:MAG: CBO2463/CBO2479 domain-containing protein [Aristaeellaceae bacterium]
MSAAYIINPVLMGGLVKEAGPDMVKIHLHGRLGVITIPRWLVMTEEALAPGHELEFYFSYLEVDSAPRDYDLSELKLLREMTPVPVGGTLTEVNDTAIQCTMPGSMGMVAVPRRWVFTHQALEIGQTANFYLSRMQVVGKRDIPARSI